MEKPNGLGYPVDSEIVVVVSPDFTKAFVTIYPPQNGGKEATADDVRAALLAKAVSYNIDNERIEHFIEHKLYGREFIAAAADEAVDGTDGEIIYKYSKETAFTPQEDENGFVDYKNLGFIRNIHANDVIAEITLPTEGTGGKDVRGVEIKAISGKPANYVIGSGTRLSPDGLTIVAAQDGNICYRQNAFCVESTVIIGADVDASVGNLDFLGDIIIKGEIMEGFYVISGGNITVGGNVTNAALKAKGNITVKKGAINSRLDAEGDVSCQFCEYTDIRAGGNVSAQDYVICTVFCGKDLKAKALNGGSYTVIGETDVKYIGTKNYAPTEVILGNNALLNSEKISLQKNVAEHDAVIDRCIQVINFLNIKRRELKTLPEDKEELMGKMVRTKLASQMEKKADLNRIAEIDSLLSEKQFRSITCKGTIYPGAKITIDSSTMKFDTETTHIKVYLDEGGNIVTGQA